MTRIDSFFRRGSAWLFPTLIVVLLSGIGGYWAAGLLEEWFFLREIEGLRAIPEVPRAPSAFQREKERGLTLKDFVTGDPFISPAASPAGEARAETREISIQDLYELEGIRLAGTVPGISVWVEEGGKQTVFLKGRTIKGYDLEDVEEDRVILRKGDSVVNVLLWYGGRLSDKDASPARPVSLPLAGSVTAARSGREGSIPRETVDRLLMNPLDEMKKFRLRPRFDGGKALGVEVQWMNKNSFLESVGVKKGDVIQTVNGLEIRNMGDVVNVINSLMEGSAFDVQVLRNGQRVSLKYSIR